MVLSALCVFAAWLAWNLYTAKSSLEAVRAHVVAARSAIVNGDESAAEAQARAAGEAATNARDALRSTPCRIVAAVPFFGDPLDALEGISDTVSSLTDGVMPHLVAAGRVLNLDQLRLVGGGLNVDQLSRAHQPIAEAVAAMANVRVAAAKIPDARFVSTVNDVRDQLRKQVAELDEVLVNAGMATQLAPSMLGAHGDRVYLVAFQTNAELRGTGGLLGGTALLKATAGNISIDRLAQNYDLGSVSQGIELGPEFDQLYGEMEATSLWSNSNISPHFPYAAKIWRDMAQKNWKTNVDGVIAVDPVALSYVLAAIGEVTLPNGEKVTSQNVVHLTESEVYDRFPTDQLARKKFLTVIASSVFNKLAAGGGRLPTLIEAAGKAANEHRLMIWSAHDDEQKVLEQTSLGHQIPETGAPYANVTVINSGPSKLDYYLRRDLAYTAGDCKDGRRDSQVSVTLTNTAPGNLPDYVDKIIGFNGPKGTNVVTVYLYATDGAELTSITRDGDPVTEAIGEGVERGHPVFFLVLALFPGEPVDLVFNLSEPAAKGTPTLDVQPLIENGPVKVSVPAC
ncbi:DUF4012 domain-containing protein [Smaragdicoccus niigatensis]